MSKLTINSVDILQFCDLQGVESHVKIILNKKYSGEKKSYTDWHDLISEEFALSPKKDFKVAKQNDKNK